MSQFLYFFTVPGNEELLKKEISLNYPHWNFSYSRPGFCTFKNIGTKIELSELSKLEITFALTWGENLGRYSEKNYLSKLDEFGEMKINFHQLDCVEENIEFPIRSDIESDIEVDVVLAKKNEIFIGHRCLDRWRSPFLRQFVSKKEDVISRAYYKVADAFRMFQVKDNSQVLEFGCVPGGMSQFCLEEGHHVIGVDPAKMDPRVLDLRNFKFINCGVHEFKVDRRNEIKYLVSDMNLSPQIVMKECSRVVRHLPKLRSVFINCKTPHESMVDQMSQIKLAFKEMRMKKIHFVQLPYHRKEFLAYGEK